ncbi:hypothetical protein [Streptomyces sp. CL12]|uniref:hypothetical protein n=1 Tax=Streptomyces sp. CL12 TaxID=3391744 RepID=UPI003A7FD684
MITTDGDTSMSPSTAQARRGTEWMNRENRRQPAYERDRRLRPARPGLWLKQLREQCNEVAAIRRGDVSRRLRFVAYLNVPPGEQVDVHTRRLLNEIARRHDAEVTYTVVEQRKDVPLGERDGWADARELISSGRVDGVIAADRWAISSVDDEYEEQVVWLGTHCAQLLLAVSEAAP